MEEVDLALAVNAPAATVIRPALLRDGVLHIEGDIGSDGITAEAVRAALAELSEADKIEVVVDSTGGQVADGFPFYHMLRESRVPVLVHVEEARSIASIIAL